MAYRSLWLTRNVFSDFLTFFQEKMFSTASPIEHDLSHKLHPSHKTSGKWCVATSKCRRIFVGRMCDWHLKFVAYFDQSNTVDSVYGSVTRLWLDRIHRTARMDSWIAELCMIPSCIPVQVSTPNRLGVVIKDFLTDLELLWPVMFPSNYFQRLWSFLKLSQTIQLSSRI